ncbi:MAG: preprotein translocase subunit YajC [Syntrophobacterales bacterium]|jgi:preprotein translocase subunit YajC|nr:preprotein translocase subunit YajC [Syntrophobacterales bacterium]
MNIAHAMGNMGGTGQGGGNQLMAFLPLILLFAVFYFLLIRPQQKKAKQQKQFLENLKKGDEVVTSGGLYGKITGITDNTVTLEIAEKIRVRILKSSIVMSVGKGE